MITLLLATAPVIVLAIGFFASLVLEHRDSINHRRSTP